MYIMLKCWNVALHSSLTGRERHLQAHAEGGRVRETYRQPPPPPSCWKIGHCKIVIRGQSRWESHAISMGKRKRVRKAREGGSRDAGGRVVRRTGRPVVLLRGGVLKPILNILLLPRFFYLISCYQLFQITNINDLMISCHKLNHSFGIYN